VDLPVPVANMPYALKSTGKEAENGALSAACEQSPYLVRLGDFLRETDAVKALSFWLREHHPKAKIETIGDLQALLGRDISAIDHLINDQLNAIIHHQRFQRLESSWRGLWYLVIQAEGTRNVKIRFLDVSWPEVVRDIDRALEFDQSQLFQKIYNDEYGTPGGEPYGALIGDYEVGHKRSERHPHDDVATLEGIAEIAAAAFAPFIAGASSELFGLDDFSALGLPLDLQAIFATEQYTRWRALRDKSDSRFLGLALPRILMRKPYRTQPGSYKGIFFYEKLERADRSDYLWGNACYAFAAVLIREFANVGWFGHIRGVPRNQTGGGLVTNLVYDVFDSDAGDIADKPVTDVIITDTTERQLSELGLMPLCQCYDLPFAAFYSNQSLQRPVRRKPGESNINARISAMLQHMLCGSRVAHYVKVIIRDKVGSFITAEECETYLTKWLFEYTTGREDLEWEEQARYPLREAAVTVSEHPDKPGQYTCVMHLVPHYQVDRMVSELELVTELVQSS
jgi:type VI secretion system protein ImpD